MQIRGRAGPARRRATRPGLLQGQSVFTSALAVFGLLIFLSTAFTSFSGDLPTSKVDSRVVPISGDIEVISQPSIDVVQPIIETVNTDDQVHTVEAPKILAISRGENDLAPELATPPRPSPPPPGPSRTLESEGEEESAEDALLKMFSDTENEKSIEDIAKDFMSSVLEDTKDLDPSSTLASVTPAQESIATVDSTPEEEQQDDVEEEEEEDEEDTSGQEQIETETLVSKPQETQMEPSVGKEEKEEEEEQPEKREEGKQPEKQEDQEDQDQDEEEESTEATDTSEDTKQEKKEEKEEKEGDEEEADDKSKDKPLVKKDKDGNYKMGDVMNLARAAAKDSEKRKDPEVKKILRQNGVETNKLTNAKYLEQSLNLLRQKAADQKEAMAKLKEAEKLAATLQKSQNHANQWLPAIKSRGGHECGVCTNGTGGNFAKGFGITIGGGAYNTAQNEKDGYATIGGGRSNKAIGEYSTVAGGYGNLVSKDDACVTGGGSNKATAHASTVGGGNSNEASGLGSAVGGGANNVAAGTDSLVSGGVYNKAGGENSMVGGGEYNTASSQHSTVMGGVMNSASHDYSVIGGGMANAATFNYTTVVGGGYNVAGKPYAVVAGGFNNTATGEDSAIVGGASNIASGMAAITLGGDNNTASGRRSLAAGHLALATHAGAFVLGDSSDVSLRSTAPNQLTVQHRDCRKPGGGAWTAAADERSMADVKDFDAGLAALKEVHPVTYAYAGGGEERYVGVVGQKLEGVGELAFMVSKEQVDPRGASLKGKDEAAASRAVDPSAFTYVLVNAVKELSARLDKLEADNRRLRSLLSQEDANQEAH